MAMASWNRFFEKIIEERGKVFQSKVLNASNRPHEPIRIKFFVNFADYFGRFLIIFWWVIYLVDITHQKIIKNRLKRTAKSTETFYPDRFLGHEGE